MTARPALGRGLSALIPRHREERESASADAPRTLSVTQIRPNPQQPRSQIDSPSLEELAASIREHGVLQPILVTRAGDGGYILVAGERRWRAAQLADLEEVPVVITEFANHDLLTVALVENLQRQDLSPLEEAGAYQRLIQDAKLTQEQVAKRVGKSRTAVANSLRLLQLPARIRKSLAAAEISEGHARAILGAPNELQQIRLWERVRARHLSVRQTELAAKQLRSLSGPPATLRRRELPGDVLAQQRLQEALSTTVHVRRGRRGGTILMRWYDDEQLEHLVGLIAGAALEPATPAPDHIDI